MRVKAHDFLNQAHCRCWLLIFQGKKDNCLGAHAQYMHQLPIERLELLDLCRCEMLHPSTIEMFPMLNNDLGQGFTGSPFFLGLQLLSAYQSQPTNLVLGNLSS